MSGMERGSEKMLEARRLEAGDLERLLQVAAMEGTELIEWFPRGIPPVVDEVGGSFRVQRSQVASLLTNVLDIGTLRLRLEVFPIGIPSPDEFIVQFSSR